MSRSEQPPTAQRADTVRFIQVIGTTSPDYGGPSVLVVELNSALRRLGVDAQVLTTDHGEPADRRVPAGEESVLRTDGGARVRVFPGSRPGRLEHSLGLARALLRESRSADVLEMHGFYLLPHVWTYLAARARKVPFGIEAHGAFEPYTRTRTTGRKAVFQALVGRRMLRDAAYVLFTSQAEADNAADLVKPRQVVVTDLGVSLGDAVADPRIAALLEGVPRERTVLYLGRLASKKRPDLLLEGWAKLPERESHRLVVAGPDGDLTRDELARRAEELGIADSVHLVGPVHGGAKTWLYRRSGLFVLPSQNENFGMTVAEALAGGCHVLTTRDTAAHAHAVAAGSGTVLDALTADAIAAGLAEVLAPGRIGDGTAAARYAASHLSWDATARTLRDHLKRILEEER